MAQVAPDGDKFTLLDIGAASGDTARLLQRLYPRASVTSLDYSPVNLESAPPPKLIADAFALPFLPGSFDYVLCSLFLHHFSDEQVARSVAKFLWCRPARSAGLRFGAPHPFVLFFAGSQSGSLGGSESRSTMDRFRFEPAFRSNELLTLSKRAGIRDARVSVHRPAFPAVANCKEESGLRNQSG